MALSASREKLNSAREECDSAAPFRAPLAIPFHGRPQASPSALDRDVLRRPIFSLHDNAFAIVNDTRDRLTNGAGNCMFSNITDSNIS